MLAEILQPLAKYFVLTQLRDYSTDDYIDQKCTVTRNNTVLGSVALFTKNYARLIVTFGHGGYGGQPTTILLADPELIDKLLDCFYLYLPDDYEKDLERLEEGQWPKSR